MVREGKVGAIGMADNAVMGYYVVKWLSKPYTLQENMDGISGTIGVGTIVVNALYFNRVERTPHWYTQSKETMVAEVRYVLLTGLHLLPISKTNKLLTVCNRREAVQKKVEKVTLLDREVIMEEARKWDQLEYDVDDDNDDDVDESKEESKEESESGNESEE
jgi:hypothetical protein